MSKLRKWQISVLMVLAENSQRLLIISGEIDLSCAVEKTRKMFPRFLHNLFIGQIKY